MAFHILHAVLFSCHVALGNSLHIPIHGARSSREFLSQHVSEAGRSALCSEAYHTSEGWPSCASAPWRPAKQKHKREFCLEGKAVPKLYVLGAQKTSTSSFANDLACAGVMPVPSPHGNVKEFSYFVARHQWDGAKEKERSAWLKALPDCKKESKRVVADFTPNNLRMVEGETPYASTVAINLPRVLRHFYGDDASRNITFVAVIREPLSRMQSAWYAARQCGNHAICTQDCRGSSFKDDLKTAMQNAKQEPPLYTEWLWTSMYGRQLQQWLKFFPASQLYVIPYKQYSQGDADAICNNLAEKLEFPMDCKSHGAGPTHAWQNDHPSLEDDLSQKVKQNFDALMKAEKKLLVDIMASGHLLGMGLANYNGTKGSKKEIRKWLESWW